MEVYEIIPLILIIDSYVFIIYQFISEHIALYIKELLQFQRPRPGEPPAPRMGDLFIGDLDGGALPPFVNVIRPV